MFNWTPVPAAPEQLWSSAALRFYGKILQFCQVLQFLGSLVGV